MLTNHLFFFIGGRSGDEALGNKLVLEFASPVGLKLLQDLSSASSTASRTAELAHVVAITLDLLLLSISTASEQFGGRKSGKGRSRGKGLEDKEQKS